MEKPKSERSGEYPDDQRLYSNILTLIALIVYSFKLWITKRKQFIIKMPASAIELKQRPELNVFGSCLSDGQKFWKINEFRSETKNTLGSDTNHTAPEQHKQKIFSIILLWQNSRRAKHCHGKQKHRRKLKLRIE